MSTLAELGELYLATCELEGKSPNTVRAYRETVGRFLRSHGVWDHKTRIELHG